MQEAKVPPSFNNEVAAQLIECYMKNEIEIAYLVESKALRTLKEISMAAHKESLDGDQRIELIKAALGKYCTTL